jgi:hypothetical protein
MFNTGNIADFFLRERATLPVAFASQNPAQGSIRYDLNGRDILAATRREVHNVNQLWLVLYQQLPYFAIRGPYFAIRGSAFRTLFNAFQIYSWNGNVFEKVSWRQGFK